MKYLFQSYVSAVMSAYYDDLVLCIYGFHIKRTKYSRMNEMQFAEDITSK